VGELVELLTRIRDAVAEHGAEEACRAMTETFIPKLKGNTPVLTSALQASERRDSMTGGGTRVSIVVSTHLPLYASFREHGGDIVPKHTFIDKRTGEEKLGYLHWPGGPFTRFVHQQGSWYMRRTDEWAQEALQAPARAAIDKIIADAGG